eukprot:10695195-Alexandrium_andersonii.AAC.1
MKCWKSVFLIANSAGVGLARRMETACIKTLSPARNGAKKAWQCACGLDVPRDAARLPPSGVLGRER